MATFGSYFGLCPLIDRRSLLGISRDNESGHVIVTLGKNIAMIYRISDQKQILSWTTKEKFSSQVIYDLELRKYVAVFNQMHVKCWDRNVKNLDKVKKIKFNLNIHTILVVHETSYVVFQNGFIMKLTEAIENAKQLEIRGVLEENQSFEDIISFTSNSENFIGMLVENDFIWTRFNENRNEFMKCKMSRDDCKLVGYTFHIYNNNPTILNLWSDGKLFIKNLNRDDESVGELHSVLESISCKSGVSLVSLDENYVSIYGENGNQDGALLIIYNMQFKLTQCKQPLKLFTTGAKMWKIDESIILPIGQNLAIIPFYLEKEQLSSLIGSHCSNSSSEKQNNDIRIVQKLNEVIWDNNTNSVKERGINLEIDEYLTEGLSESSIIQEIVPKYLESKDTNNLVKTLETFEDIPEKYFVELLKYFLNPSNFSEEILMLILSKPINEVSFIPHLRTLDFDTIVKLLDFIISRLNEDDFNTNLMKKMTEWLCLILDANYQSFLLSKDENVKRIVLSAISFVDDELNNLKDLQRISSFMQQICRSKKISKIVENDYNVERINL